MDRFKGKSTVQQIRERFDGDVERFSNLETGQTATVDAPLVMDLITDAAIASTAPIGHVLDIGCGAGNTIIKLRRASGADFTAHLVDLSRPMLNRAAMRLAECNRGEIVTFAEDFRTVDLQPHTYDVILAAAVLHHLREDADWHSAFEKIFSLLAPGGSVWISDLVFHESPAVQAMMWRRYGEYLAGIGGEAYRDQVLAYIDLEDSPRPVTFQLDLLRQVGFSRVELLHKNSCFAAFGAVKS